MKNINYDPVFRVACLAVTAFTTVQGIKFAVKTTAKTLKGWAAVGAAIGIAGIAVYGYASGACN